MRIAILCHYFHPEIGAPSARLHALSKDLTSFGHQVVVVTGFPNHPTGIIPPRYRGKLIAREELDGFTILRCWLYATPNSGFLKKTLGHLSFMVASVLLGGPRLGTVDAIIVSSPTFFSVISGWVLSIVKRAPFVFEVRDLWPAIFVDLGIIRNRAVISVLEFLEMFLYRRSAAVVTVTDSFREILVRRGIPEAKVSTITNGVDLDSFTPGAGDSALRSELGATDSFVVLYIGAHGISHALEAILRAAQRLKADGGIRFLFVGEGAEKAALERRARELRLENVIFLPAQPRDAVLKYYRTADICLVPLRDISLFDTFIPSKMFEIMACARPIIASVRGEAARILEASGSAEVVSPEDDAAIARAVASLKAAPGRREEMGRSGRSFVTAHYQRRDLARKYEGLLREVCSAKEPG